MQEQAVPQGKVHRYRCPGCGADLQFAPEGGRLTCPYCGHQEQIAPSDDKVEEHSYDEYLQLHADRMGTLAEGALEVQCQTCGATVTFTPPQVAGECDFCGSPMVAQAKSADPVLAPEGVLPFRVTQDAATDAIRRWLASRWFAPNALKKFAAQEGIGGDEQRVNQISTNYSAITFKHLLLPVYVGAYRFHEKVYQVVINGRTGEVQGERPYSFWKIFFFVLALLTVLITLILVFGHR